MQKQLNYFKIDFYNWFKVLSNTTMSEYIYYITNSKYKIDDIYKLGYTAAKMTIDEVRAKLLQRY